MREGRRFGEAECHLVTFRDHVLCFRRDKVFEKSIPNTDWYVGKSISGHF